MAYCAKCFHRDVCKSCDSCDGHVPGCQNYIDRDALADEINDLRTMLAELQQAAQPRKTGKWQEWRPPKNMVLVGVTKLYACSECCAKFVQTFRYCPHCGTLMEKEGPEWTTYGSR